MNAYISFGGHSGQIIYDPVAKTWHLQSDDGSTVNFLTGAANGAYNGEYWEVITPDGTQYWFGLDELPGWAGSDPKTNSVWTMPVTGLGTGDPCHNASYASSYCPNMPWRWNLDLVVDPNGNATEYYYTPQTSYYAYDSYVDSSGTAHYGAALPYTFAGTLTDIYYGAQDNSADSHNAYAHRPFDLHFGYSDRCTSTTQSTCAANENGTYWPDTPWDLYCGSSSSCKGVGHVAPAFFDTLMLTPVTTSAYEGSSPNQQVDTWTLGYQWLTADVNSDLVLASVARTGGRHVQSLDGHPRVDQHEQPGQLRGELPSDVPVPAERRDLRDRGSDRRHLQPPVLQRHRADQVLHTYNTANGLLLETSDLGDLSQPGQAMCTIYAYPSAPSTAGLLDYPDEVQDVAGACPSGTPALVSDSDTALQSDTKYYYDLQAFGVAPAEGNVTETDVYSAGDPGVAAHWVQQSRDTYDSYGRLLNDENSAGYTTSDSYTSSYGTGDPTTQVKVTSPLTASTSATTTTDMNPGWGLPNDMIDASGQRTDYAYDNLGRVTSVWLPGQTGSTRSKDGTANYVFTYSVTATAAPYVETTRLTGTNLVPVSSYQIFDSLLRPRQTRAPAEGPGGGSEVTDTFYDSQGNTVIANGPYNISAAASGTLWKTTEPNVPDETASTYDGAGRITESDFDSYGTQEWKTTWSYGGADEVTVTPPSGGTVTSTFTDARGRTTQIDQYHCAALRCSAGFDGTAYTYAYVTGGQKNTAADAGGNQWTWTYDLLGRQVSATDPDTGTTTQTWNDLGQPTSVTDGAGKTVSFIYDHAGRKIAEYASAVSGQSTANQLTAWAYDTATLNNSVLASGSKAIG
jgi:YD repeat-containing protein